MNRDDTLWKGILENVFDDFLRFFFADADSLFDMQKEFQYLDKELEQLFPLHGEASTKFVDKLVKVFTKEGKEEWILVHIEIQGYDDKHFPQRMFTYFYRILDKYNKPVTAIAIFTDTSKKPPKNTYEYHYLGTRNTFQFNTYKISEQDEKMLEDDNNPFAAIVLTVLLALKKKKADDESLYSIKYALAKKLLQKQFSRAKIDNILIFLQLYIHFANPSYNSKFDKAIELLTDNATTMGIREQVIERAKKEGLETGLEKGMKEGLETGLEKGLKQGREQERYLLIKNLLSDSNLAVAKIARLTNTTEAYVDEIQRELR